MSEDAQQISRVMERFSLDETTARRVTLMYGADTETVLDKRRLDIETRQRAESEARARAENLADMNKSE